MIKNAQCSVSKLFLLLAFCGFSIAINHQTTLVCFLHLLIITYEFFVIIHIITLVLHILCMTLLLMQRSQPIHQFQDDIFQKNLIFKIECMWKMEKLTRKTTLLLMLFPFWNFIELRFLDPYDEKFQNQLLHMN